MAFPFLAFGTKTENFINHGDSHGRMSTITFLARMARLLSRLSVRKVDIIKVKTDLFEKKNRMYHRSDLIHTMFKIATEVFMVVK